MACGVDGAEVEAQARLGLLEATSLDPLANLRSLLWGPLPWFNLLCFIEGNSPSDLAKVTQ